jgi:cytochrome c556
MEGVKMSMHALKLLRIGFLSLFPLVISSQAFAQEEEILKRRLLMESNNDAATKAIKQAIKEKNFPEIQLKAGLIMENMDKVLGFFPKGSTSEKSRAKPEIWERWDEFSKNPSKVRKAAQELADAAKANDEAGVNAKYKALGEACANCHKTFRAAKKKNGG